jgi:putative endonuclease
MKLGGSVYIITNKHHTVLYTGVTSDLRGRIYKHRTKKYSNSFTARYNCDKVVYYKFYSTITEAIAVEKQIKDRSRAYKEKLIKELNPEWKDLWEEIEKW